MQRHTEDCHFGTLRRPFGRGIRCWPPASRRPSIAEPINEAGNVPKGDKITHDFLIKNEGDADLQITNVQPACGCTVAELRQGDQAGPDRQGARGGRLRHLQRPDRQGGQRLHQRPDHPQIELTVRAKVEPYITVKPGYARYITVQGEAQEGNDHPDPVGAGRIAWDVTGVDSPFPSLKVSLPRGQARGAAPGRQGEAVEGGDEALQRRQGGSRWRTT